MKYITPTQIGLGMALLIGNAIILSTPLEWVWLRLPAAFMMLFILPGWAWLPSLNWLATDRLIERLWLVPGVSLVLSAIALFLTVRLTSPFTETPVMVAINLTILAGWGFQFFRRGGGGLKAILRGIEWPSRSVLVILLLIMAVATFTRTVRLGYGEFHEDELENMRLIVRAYKGEAYAAFLDSKGPIHWLLPAGLWYLNGWINEALARLPFVLASLLLVPLSYSLGRRLSHDKPAVGLLAAGLVGLNGFFVALARHVENRSLLIFWGALLVWLLYRYYQERLPHFLIYIALTLAISLITHPLFLLYAPVAIFVIGLAWWRDGFSGWHGRWLVTAGLVGVALSSTFYIPYLLDPNISLVYQYFAEERVGTSFLYNRVDNMFEEDRFYSSRYYSPILVFLLWWLLIRQFAHWRWLGWGLLTGLSLAIVSTVIRPGWWLIGPLNLAFMPYALLTLAVLSLPQTSFEIKLLVVWFSVPFGALMFLAQDASNHIQMAYSGWVVLSAMAAVDLWHWLTPTPETSWRPMYLMLQASLVIVGLTVTPLIVYHEYLSFGSEVTTYWQARRDSQTNPNSIYNRLYGSIIRPRKIISNPRLGGWKAVGYLYETGRLTGDFRSINESFAVPIWYTFQTPRSCYEDPHNYWLRRDMDGWPSEEEAVIEQGYQLTGVVLVDQQPKVRLYDQSATNQEPQIFDVEMYRHRFDLLATPARFAQGESIQVVTAFNFGDKLDLRGYNLPPSPVQPGDLLSVTVFWESLTPMTVRYRAFVHLLDEQGNLWAQHDDDPACRLLTTEMRPGQTSSRQFRLRLDPTTPPGEYQLRLGLYDPADVSRLSIWDNLTHQTVGDSLLLGTIQVN